MGKEGEVEGEVERVLREYVLGGERRMEDIKERVEKSQERTFEHKVVELEQSAFRLLALTKELHGNFLLYKEGVGNRKYVELSASRIVGEIKYLYRAFSDLENALANSRT